MSGVRTGARWYLRAALAAVLLFDLGLLAAMLSVADPDGPRVLEAAPRWLHAFAGRPELVVPVALLGAAAVVRFALAPGRIGAALGALAAIAVLSNARAANVGGPERFLFAGGTVLVGWLAGLAFSRAGDGDRRDEERAAEIGAVAALAAIYVNAGAQKILASGITWADGDELRLLVLSQRPVDAGFPTSTLADLVIHERSLALAMAAFVEIAQLSAVLIPFHPRARAVVGTALLAFHAGVRLLTPISFPQSMALLVIFSYPWGRLLEARGVVAPDPARPLVRRPGRGAAMIVVGAALLTGLSILPPVRALVGSLSHLDGAPRPHPEAIPPPGPAPLDAAAAQSIGLVEGSRVGPCALLGGERRGEEIQLRLACDDGALRVDVVPSGVRPGEPPRRAAGQDLFYRRADPGAPAASDATRDAALDALAEHLEGRARSR